MWSKHYDCETIISEWWKSNLVGCPMYILKLKLLK